MRGRGAHRGLDRALLAAIAVGAIGGAATLIGSAVKLTGDMRPFPPFAADLHRGHDAVIAGYAGLWLAWVIATSRRSYGAAGGHSPMLVMSLLAGLVTAGACLGAYTGVECANALLDFSSPRPTPVFVQRYKTKSERSKAGGSVDISFATVNRVDHPGEAIDVNWDSCTLIGRATLSPFATLRIGRGLFGVPWVDFPVGCRALAIGDRPLIGDVFLGRGTRLVFIALRAPLPSLDPAPGARDREALRMYAPLTAIADGRQPPDYLTIRALRDSASAALAAGEAAELDKLLDALADLPPARAAPVARRALAFVRAAFDKRDDRLSLSRWLQALRAGPPAAVVVAFAGDRPAWLSPTACPGCRVVARSALDGDILTLLVGNDDAGSHVYAVNADGSRGLSAALSDYDRIRELATWSNATPPTPP